MARGLCGGLNRSVPEVIAQLEETDEMNDSINTAAITKDDIRSSLWDMESGKALGTDSITADLLKADSDTTVNVMQQLFNTISFFFVLYSIGLLVEGKDVHNAAPAGSVGRSLLCCIPADVCFLQLFFN